MWKYWKILKVKFLNCRRQILQEVAQYSDFTSEKHREIQRRIENGLDAIKHTEEYNDFTEKHK